MSWHLKYNRKTYVDLFQRNFIYQNVHSFFWICFAVKVSRSGNKIVIFPKNQMNEFVFLSWKAVTYYVGLALLRGLAVAIYHNINLTYTIVQVMLFICILGEVNNSYILFFTFQDLLTFSRLKFYWHYHTCLCNNLDKCHDIWHVFWVKKWFKMKEKNF